MKKEELKDYTLKNVFASNGKYRLWCSFSPYFDNAIYKLENLKTKEVVLRVTNLDTAIEAYNET